MSPWVKLLKQKQIFFCKRNPLRYKNRALLLHQWAKESQKAPTNNSHVVKQDHRAGNPKVPSKYLNVSICSTQVRQWCGMKSALIQVVRA